MKYFQQNYLNLFFFLSVNLKLLGSLDNNFFWAPRGFLQCIGWLVNMKVPCPAIDIAFYGFEGIHFLQLLHSSSSVPFRGVQKCSSKKLQIFVGEINQVPKYPLSYFLTG